MMHSDNLPVHTRLIPKDGVDHFGRHAYLSKLAVVTDNVCLCLGNVQTNRSLLCSFYVRPHRNKTSYQKRNKSDVGISTLDAFPYIYSWMAQPSPLL